jgi:hypothetical protein
LPLFILGFFNNQIVSVLVSKRNGKQRNILLVVLVQLIVYVLQEIIWQKNISQIFSLLCIMFPII